MKRDGTWLKESGGEGIAGGGGRSVVTRGVVTRGVVTRGVVTRGVVTRKVVTRGVAWIHDLGVLQEEWLRGVCFAVFASPCLLRRACFAVLASQCLLRSVCFAGLALRGLYPGAYFKVTTSKFQLRNFGEASDFARLKLCGHQTLRVAIFACITLCV